MHAVGGCVEGLGQPSRRHVLAPADFLPDDFDFLCEFLLVEGRVFDDVCQDVDSLLLEPGRHVHVVDGHLPAGVGVDLATGRLHFPGDGSHTAALRSLE